ncbi:ethylene-responsive transcription factor ERF020 [Rhodamnia argentea]|uniref:Ethylene-responsive transcription factor ERF020 n=1 Tax=Rhodamnia argentea TaxID=178133 RepID=A0A8B8NKD1_9MYRT|nr:ethylene-responsive transcription factor ERF020 [Rhodamnia argentea]
MSSSSSEEPRNNNAKYAGVRRRKWGKWVSEIRVPGTQERLWLGSYATPEGAAVAHDIASYCLRGPSCLDKLNFPALLPPSARPGMSPTSVQRAASDAGMAVDAQHITRRPNEEADGTSAGHHPRADGTHAGLECAHGSEACSGTWEGRGGDHGLSISVDDYL